jgi:RNA polymerase sigma-70 factor (ECF subfamily)
VSYSFLTTQELVQTCAHSNAPPAWEEFVRRFHNLIAGVALRTARRWGETSPQIVEELVQETYMKICADDARLLRSFESQHAEAFCGFLKVITTNLVHDYFKSRRAEKRGWQGKTITSDQSEQVTADEKALPSLETSVDRRVLLREIDDCLQSLVRGATAGRDRRIFWLYYRVGLPATAIAALPPVGLATKGIESTLQRLTRDLRQQLAAKTGPEAPDGKPKGFQRSESF